MQSAYLFFIFAAPMELTAIIEALLIASEDPLPISEIARLVRARVAEAEDALAADAEDYDAGSKPELPEHLSVLGNLNEDAVTLAIAELNHNYEITGRAFLCAERAKGWKIYTRPDYAEFVRQLFPGRKPSRLSGPAMETLAIIAYRQPVTKASLEAVRGVSCDGMLQKLLDRELVKVGGRAELPGRPLLYETTDLFFEHFGVKSVDELPNADELRSVKLPEPKDVVEEDSDDSANSDDKAEDADNFTAEEIEKQLALTAAGVPKAEAVPESDSKAAE
ncbi:SMC-Scp complex subunit ScpB [Verrucomicrobiaceae bacterium 5K15]|uniref:SMC-Scp complex subunit ScpB n=1 Tax=Oceaniferula flava TaxID=2800421 RepID=A0AAE2VDX5_9BACT|nr:SMC-Scp complex subunit ScpB [Oceaniferula flavus]MBK1856451.1 SMC-Scp complex subunit ScpB [Oceaniferula flavus]MBM1137758.1 SMC-Scp complex subunit ScpB [Oceaniferula flavus]